MRNIVLGLLALSASTVVNAEEESKEHPEWFIPDPVQESPVQPKSQLPEGYTYADEEPATTEPQQEVVEPKLTHKGVFNCVSQDSRHHSIERNIATFGGVGDLNSGDAYKYEYAGTEGFIDGRRIPNSRYVWITGVGFFKGGIAVCEEEDSFQRCGGEGFFDISANKFKIIYAGHILTLARTYKEDWAGFELYLPAPLTSPPKVFVTPLTCKRTVLIGE